MASDSISQPWPENTPVTREAFVDTVENLKARFQQTYGRKPQSLDLPRHIADAMLGWDRNEWGGDVAGDLFYHGLSKFPEKLLELNVNVVDGNELRVY